MNRFQKGVAISVWQNSGDSGDSNWTRYTKQCWPLSSMGWSAIRGLHNIDNNTDFWNRYKEDIGLAKQLGCTSFRFSIEWARVEPKRGCIDPSAVQWYHDILDCLAEHGMEPNATLHHFVHPGWFEDLGGFTKEANIPIFVGWAVKAFELWGDRIKLWATFNEPTCYMFLGWIVGIAPPAKMLDFTGAGRVLQIMLKCHTAAYHAMRKLPGGEKAQIGLVSHHMHFLTRGNGLLYCAAKPLAHWLTYWLGWDVVDHWMLTGEFKWKLPLVGDWIVEKDPAGKPPCDWWGINYYSRCVLSWYLQPTTLNKELLTDMYYPVYPEGLYHAIERSSAYGIPMYVTETGVADALDTKRAVMIDTYFKEVLRAIGDGYDVRGFYYWTLVDCFEWATGYAMKFGLYAWEPDGSKDRMLKDGSRPLIRFYKTLPDTMPELKAVVDRARKQKDVDL
ncbi:MAG: hypothetical protein WDW38_001436 [Sanguina aurantia]